MYTFRAEYIHTYIHTYIYTYNTYILKCCTHAYTRMQSATCAKKIEAHRPQGSCPTLHSRGGMSSTPLTKKHETQVGKLNQAI